MPDNRSLFSRLDVLFGSGSTSSERRILMVMAGIALWFGFLISLSAMNQPNRLSDKLLQQADAVFTGEITDQGAVRVLTIWTGPRDLPVTRLTGWKQSNGRYVVAVVKTADGWSVMSNGEGEPLALPASADIERQVSDLFGDR